MTRATAAAFLGGPFSGVRSLSAVLAERQAATASRDASHGDTCLYAVRKDGQVVAYPVTKWTPKRVYFVQAKVTLAEGRTFAFVYHVSREALDRSGEAPIAGAGWPAEIGNRIYLHRETAEIVASADPRRLRKAMAEAHPDRGGTSEEFIAARERYELAISRQKG